MCRESAAARAEHCPATGLPRRHAHIPGLPHLPPSAHVSLAAWTNAAFLKDGATALQLHPFGWELPGGRPVRCCLYHETVFAAGGSYLQWTNSDPQLAFFNRQNFQPWWVGGLLGGQPFAFGVEGRGLCVDMPGVGMVSLCCVLHGRRPAHSARRAVLPAPPQHARPRLRRGTNNPNATFHPHPAPGEPLPTAAHQDTHWVFQNSYLNLTTLGPVLDEAMRAAGIPPLKQRQQLAAADGRAHDRAGPGVPGAAAQED